MQTSISKSGNAERMPPRVTENAGLCSPRFQPHPSRSGVSQGRQANRFAHLLWILGPCLVLLAAVLLDTGRDRQVLLPGSSIALPETCTLHTRFGLDCPGCGLTRGFIHIADGDPMTAWRLNPMSLPLFAFIASQIPLAILHASQCRRPWMAGWTRLNERLLVVLVIAMLLLWGWRLAVQALG